jgi:hypothetical protein
MIKLLPIICVKGHLSRKKKFKYPYLSSNKIRISAVSYSADTHTNLNISTNSEPNSKIYYGVNQRPIWGRFMKKTRGRQSRATVPLNIHITAQISLAHVSLESKLDDVFCQYTLLFPSLAIYFL